ncbi:MAG TPA: NifU family protein [Dissulfurispiraceae bacterium]|nr:NifU family protein [Dissulfurispiraceae bacterium]
MITKEAVEVVLDKVRVGLKTEGGNVELIDIKDDIVYVKLTGACGTCPMSQLTLKNWVEATVKKEIPGVKAVQSI